MEKEIEQAILRTIAFFDAMDYAMTWTECVEWIEWHSVDGLVQKAIPSVSEIESVRDRLVAEKRIDCALGRIALVGRLEELASLSFVRTAFLGRKIKKAKRVARWLSYFSSVRFVSIVNTTALGHARHESDLDFFVVVKHGSIWSTRFFAVSPYRLFGKLAHRDAKPDAICMSYFISDEDLSLNAHMLPEDDPYYRYWFLAMLPIYDDGISVELWNANSDLRSRHPNASLWSISSDWCVSTPNFRIPFSKKIESLARSVQMAWFPSRITDRMNRDTSVLVTDHTLKFHTDDARDTYKDAYLKRLKELGME